MVGKGLTRIGPAAESPRAAERFPYRPRPGYPEDVEAIRAEAGQIVLGIERMIAAIVGRLVPDAQDADREDLAAIAMAHIMQRLDRFDASRRAKLTTFLHRVAWTRLLDERRRHSRRVSRTAEQQLFAEVIPTAPLRPDIDRRAAAVADDPQGAGGLTRLQARAMERWSTTTQTLTEVAAELGLARSSSLSMMRRRCSDRIAERDIEDFPDRPPPADSLNFERLTGLALADARRREGELVRTLPPAEASLISLMIEQSGLDVPGIARRLGVRVEAIEKMLEKFRTAA